MRKFFKKYFIPHPGNEHKPHILRIEATLFILSIVVIAEIVFLLQSFVIQRGADFFATILPNVLVDQTNENREVSNVGILETNPLLEEAARLKAEDMASSGYFAHTSPSGQSPWFWLSGVGYTFSAAGENLAVNFVDSEDVTDAWMESEGHRTNILNSSFTEVGIATARGIYKGRETTFVVQFFGRPALQIAQAGGTVSAGTTEDISIEETSGNELFIEIQSVTTNAEADEVVAPAQFKAQSSLIEQVAAQPKTNTNYLLVILGSIIALALVLKIFIRLDIQHTPLIVNGVLLLIIISSAILLNQYISTLGAEII